MNPLLYALNIGTLATWLTVAGASTVATVIHIHQRLPKLNDGRDEEVVIEIMEEAMGSAPPAAPEDAALSEEDVPQEEVVPEEIPEVPEIPEIPEVADLAPLPDVPDLPAKPDGEIKPKPQAATTHKTTDKPKQQARATTTRRSGPSGNGTGTGAGTAQGSGNSPVGADRWAGLRKAKPNYPSSAKSAGQQGRVIVAFTVDERGYVVNAWITGPCSSPALNDAALASVRRFKAKPGPRASTSQTVVFRLN